MASDINFALAALVLDYQYDTHFPAGSILDLYTGPAASPENAMLGTLLWTFTLPASPWAAGDAATGTKAKNGTWSALSVAIGVIGSYALHNVADTRRERGSVTVTGGGGDATVNNVTVGSIGLVIAVTTFTKRLVRH